MLLPAKILHELLGYLIDHNCVFCSVTKGYYVGKKVHSMRHCLFLNLQNPSSNCAENNI